MLERFIASRYLRSSKGAGFAYVVTWFSFIGIALGVATLIIVTSVMNGFREELLTRIVGMKGHIVVSSAESSNLKHYEDIAKKIKDSDAGIISATPTIEQQVVLMSGGQARGVMVQGISQSDLSKKSLISKNIKYGNIKDFQKNTVFIGKRLAETLRVKLGDTISLFIPGGVVTPFGNLPKEETFEISGVFEVGMNEYDKNIVIMPLASAQSFFNMKKSASQIEIFVKDVEESKPISMTIANNLGDKMTVLDWQHSDSSFFHAVVVQKNVMTLILSIIILVAVFNIISGLIMLTNSKTRDIAILRTIGATKTSILKIFFYIGASIGVLGTTTGVTLGLLVSLNIDKIKQFLERFSHGELFSEEIYFLSQIPSKIDWTEVTYIVLISLALCFLATIYPARKAAKLDPVEALRM